MCQYAHVPISQWFTALFYMVILYFLYMVLSKNAFSYYFRRGGDVACNVSTKLRYLYLYELLVLHAINRVPTAIFKFSNHQIFKFIC